MLASYIYINNRHLHTSYIYIYIYIHIYIIYFLRYTKGFIKWPGRLVISNYGCYTENISALFEYYLKLIAQKFKSYIKDTNDFLSKLDSLPS